MSKDQLVTRNYGYILAANFLLFFAFYLILPVLPFYLTEEFGIGNALVGVILSCYTVAALCIRPFSGYLLDTFSRKPLYLLSYFTFTLVFAGYMLATVLTLFIMLRVVHGLSFGMVTVAGNTLVIDITPSSRRGEAVGYYGLMNNTAMSFGPMTGLFMHEICSFETIFLVSLLSGTAGFLMACMIKSPSRPPVSREPISLDRFVLIKGIPAGISLLLLSVPYGMTSTYIAVYAQEIGIQLSSGLFFTFLAIGMAVSRLFSGKQVDKGRITQVIRIGMYLVCVCYFLLAACDLLIRWNQQLTTVLFFTIALLLGTGFGTMFPAFNSLFINLAPNSKRGTATSTYLTSWDVGIGLGLTAGGWIGQHFTFSRAYLLGACLTVISVCWFTWKVSPHFQKNRIS